MEIAEVLSLADKAGLWWPMGSSAEALHGRACIAAFALLVEIAERERCAAVCEAGHVGERIDDEDLHPCDAAYNRALQDAAQAIRKA